VRDGERQVAPDLSGIRRDHLARYEWVASRLAKRATIIDLACGIGYGSSILADAGAKVFAFDNDAEAIAYGSKHYHRRSVSFSVKDATKVRKLPAADAAVCFETIEHLEHPLELLKKLRRSAPVLYASVPNEDRFPWRNYRFHFRHYTAAQFAELLAEAGFEVTEWLGQEGPQSEVETGMNGRTLIVVAKRSEKRGAKIAKTPVKSSKTVEFSQKKPESVAILGLGPSLKDYIGLATRAGCSASIADEIWGINAAIDVVKCDRGFHMDDVRIQEARGAANPSGNIAAMLPWLRNHPGPIYTSRPHPDYPGLVPYPLQDVLNSCIGQRYFNSTAAYAVAFAIHLGVKKIILFGFDFSYANSHDAEKGRACVEFWLGIAVARGIQLAMPGTTTLLDACGPKDQRLYGYDTLKVSIGGPSGAEIVSFEPREVIPSAEEIEARYDHSRPTVPESIARQS
jgi:SAM-dependent methyltransferase